MIKNLRIPVLVLLLSAAVVPGLGAQNTKPPVADVFQATFDAVELFHWNAPTDSALWESALQGLIEGLHDPYAAVFTPREAEAWDEETTGNYSGIGLQITQLNNRITVTAVFRGTPAEQVGIQVGDVIVGVNDHDATDWSTDMAADSIKGPVGTMVTVRIQRPGFDEPISFDIRRAKVHVPAVNYGVIADAGNSGLGYVILDRVARNAATELDQALGKMEGISGLIIDLRRNPGGFLDESLMLADIFLEPGSVLASTVQRVPGGGPGETTTESFHDRWPARVPDLPVILLVDRFTASGAEILAGALQDYDRGLVVGERTFGKGLVQTIRPLPHGRRLRITTGEWQTPLGRSLHRKRDMEMRPLPEKLDSLPRVTTPGGRTLIDGGGVFPDLAVRNDTLTTAEQTLIRTANEAQFPLGLRLAEFSFAQAKRIREADSEVPELDPQAFQVFLDSMVAEGLPEEVLSAPGVRDYLAWRARLGIAQRMNDVGHEARFRMERDRVLARAVRLLDEASTQAELYTLVAAEAEPGTGEPKEQEAPSDTAAVHPRR
ncbi:MAG: S41 family peptidase [Gemmatimonadota bacterium]